MSATPTFTGQRAVILHRPGETTERLARQLGLLGLAVAAQWAPLEPERTPADLVLVDADAGWSGLLPWDAGPRPRCRSSRCSARRRPDASPGRSTRAPMRIIAKPVAASAVYPGARHGRRGGTPRPAARRTAWPSSRSASGCGRWCSARSRPSWRRGRCDEADAYRHLRREAMRRRLALEQVAAADLGRHCASPEAG